MNKYMYEIISLEGGTRSSGFCSIVGVSGASIKIRDSKTNQTELVPSNYLRLFPLQA